MKNYFVAVVADFAYRGTTYAPNWHKVVHVYLGACKKTRINAQSPSCFDAVASMAVPHISFQ
jgi:hypothetical protein